MSNNVTHILSRQNVKFEFHNDKIYYFSTSTQWQSADNIEDAILNIIEWDKQLDGKTINNYLISEIEGKYEIPPFLSKESWEKEYASTWTSKEE